MQDFFNGYAGKQLRVLLDEKKVKVESLNPDILKKYIGGVGYAAKILYDELIKNTDPLGPNNKIVFATGPLTAYNVPGGGSIELCFKSPLTNAWGECRCGGNFGPDLRKAGYDFIIIEGKAKKPIYLVITDDNVEFKNASHLQGKIVTEKIKIIHEELIDPQVSIMCIGPAGENLVRFSAVMYESRAAGRCGAGAVMGSKNLMAIAVKGTGKIKPANSENFKKSVRETMKIISKHPNTSAFQIGGTTCEIVSSDKGGDWPTKNWQSNSWGKGKELYDYFLKNNFVSKKMCYRGCPVACGRIAKVENGIYKTPQHGGTEYESISAFTAFVLNEDMDAAVHCTYLCNEYGLDTISTGAVIAFAMECYEKGIIKQNDIGGLNLSWGNTDVLPTLIKKIAKKEDVGNILAEGVKRAAEIFGKKAKKFAIHVKGLEGPAHDPRASKSLAITYGTSNRGMCHIHPVEAQSFDYGKMSWGLIPYGLPDPNIVDRLGEKGKGKIVKLLQDGCIIPDILGVCKFIMYVGITINHFAEILSALTGRKIDGSELLKIGERTINLQRLFNIREGFNSNDDLIPERIKQKPLFGNYKNQEKCVILDYEGMLKEYYKERGWNVKTGIPKKVKLKQLELEKI